MHMRLGTDEGKDESDPRVQKLLRSDTCRGCLLVREEASQQDHLTDADHQKDDGFSNGPESNSSVEVLCTTSPLGLTETEVCLIVNDRFEGLVDGHTC